MTKSHWIVIISTILLICFFTVLTIIIMSDRPSREERNKQLIEECRSMGGTVKLDAWNDYSGCLISTKAG